MQGVENERERAEPQWTFELNVDIIDIVAQLMFSQLLLSQDN